MGRTLRAKDCGGLPYPLGKRGGCISLLIALGLGIFVFLDFESAGPRNANAFEAQSEVKTKQDQSKDTIFFKGQIRDAGWLNIKFDGSVVDLYPTRADALTAYGLKAFEAAPEKNTLSDTRVTLGAFDDWVRVTSRQAVSSYFKTGTDLNYLRQTGAGFDNGAMSQRIETGILKTGWMKVSVFADYARVGAYFGAPDGVIKRQDPFSKANSTTTQLGATFEQGPFIVTLAQRSQQSLAQDNAPIQVDNQVGVSLNFDELFGRSGRNFDGMSWLLPSSAYVNGGQGRIKASLSQGVNGDATSDLSAGLSWSLGKIYATFGYWQSEYQSALYPWKGFGLNGSLSYNEGIWGIDTYFDLGRSLSSYDPSGLQPLAAQSISNVTYITSGLRFHTRLAP